MSIMRLTADAFGVLCELVIISYVFKHMMKDIRVTKRIYYLVNCICLFLLTLVTLLPDNRLVMPLSNFAVVILLSFLFRNKWYIKLFIALVLSALFVLSEIIVGTLLVAITHIEISGMQEEFLSYIIGLLASKLLLFLLIKVLIFRKLDLYADMRWRSLLGLMLTPISGIVAMYAIGISLMHYEGQSLMLIVLATSILLCISDYFVFYLFENLIRSEQAKAKLAFAEKQIGFQVEYIKDMSQRQSEIRTLSHDMKHYMAGLWGFIKGGNSGEASDFIEKIMTELKKADSVFDTGYPALDAILRLKKQRMDSSSIRLDSFITLPGQISVNVMDLCVIIGNGLDNAIEACENLQIHGDKYIRLRLKVQEKYISISIENPSDLIAASDGPLKSTKVDAQNHGLGLESMRAVTRKYDGSLSVSCKDHVFKLAAMMKND